MVVASDDDVLDWARDVAAAAEGNVADDADGDIADGEDATVAAAFYTPLCPLGTRFWVSSRGSVHRPRYSPT